MATIKDVARESGVSATTVSHVLNSTRKVSPDTVERVEKAIAKLGYEPSGVARALKVKKTYSIGMLVTNSTNPFFAEVIHGVETGCFDQGFSLILCNTDDVLDKLVVHLRALMMKRIDGLVVMTTNGDPQFFKRLEELKRTPVVAIDTGDADVVSVINDDSLRGGRMAGEYLASFGFDRVGCITGPADHPRSRERITGLEAALQVAGVKIPADLRVTSDLTVQGGYQAMQALLALPARERPDAVFACNDLSAMGALCAIHEKGLTVPGDISVMGYDDIEYAAFMSPPLTTIRQPAFELGNRAAKVLIEHLKSGTKAPQTMLLQPELMERSSVGPSKRSKGRAA